MSEATTVTTTLTIPTYESSKNSDAVKNAKALLNAGDFEGTLEIIEDALVKTNELLVKCSKGEEADFHESIAPLSYLYGTTLLYSIEESQDTTIMEAQAVQAQAQKISGETSQQQQQQKQESVVDANNMNNNATEDIEIAWENLDVSRAILEKLHTQNPSNTLYAIDLAQVHQRLGDLQRGNGNYHGATLDFQKSLSIRYKILGRFDRTVADSHYSLGMTYLLCAAVVAEESTNNDKKDDNSLSEAEKEAKKSDLRRKAVLHYLSCGCSFAGLIANMCGEDEHEISSVSMDTLESEGMDDFNTAAWWEEDDEPKKMSAAKKAEKGDNKNITQKCSNALLKIRQKVSKLNLKTTTDISEQIHDMKEVLDEIQETIDSSEESVKVVDDLSKMKSEREMEAEREDENALKAGLMASLKSATGSASASGATTTIGFGGGSSTAVASASTSATTTIGFGTASSSSSAAAAFASSATAASGATINTVMVKKKKKKRTPQANDAEETKRVKTE